MTNNQIVIVSAAGVAVAALVGAGTFVALKRRNRAVAEVDVPAEETTVADGAEAFLAEETLATV